MEQEERDDLIELVDEKGLEMKFEYLATIDMNGNEYVVLLPFDENMTDNQDVDEVVILKIEYVSKSEAAYPGKPEENQESGESTAEDESSEDDQEEIFVSVDDESELNAVFEEFKKRIRDQYSTEES